MPILCPRCAPGRRAALRHETSLTGHVVEVCDACGLRRAIDARFVPEAERETVMAARARMRGRTADGPDGEPGVAVCLYCGAELPPLEPGQRPTQYCRNNTCRTYLGREKQNGRAIRHRRKAS